MESTSAAPGKPKAIRRKYLIDRQFQLKYTLMLMVVGTAASVLSAALVYHLLLTQIATLPADCQRVLGSLRTPTGLLLATVLVMATVLGIFGVLVTHRMAGPLFVVSRYLKVIGDGRFPALRPLRRDDELKEFYEIFHRAVASLKERSRADGELLEKIALSLEERTGDVSGVKAAAGELRAMSKRLLESTGPATPPAASKGGGSAAA